MIDKEIEEIKKNFEDGKILNYIRDLMKLRNTNKAFGLDGKCITEVNGNTFSIIRTCGEHKAILKVNLKIHDFIIEI